MGADGWLPRLSMARPWGPGRAEGQFDSQGTCKSIRGLSDPKACVQDLPRGLENHPFFIAPFSGYSDDKLRRDSCQRNVSCST